MEVLVKWMSIALQKALFEKNIKSGFRTTRIFPFNFHTIDDKMDPLEFYRQPPMPTAATLGKPDTVDLAAPKTIHGIEGTWINEADKRRGVVVQAGFDSDIEAVQVPPLKPDEGAYNDSNYESDAEEEYMNQLDLGQG
jgi:hypothetical protein